MDEPMPGFNESAPVFGAATALREFGSVSLNFADYGSWLDNFYRVRVNSVSFFKKTFSEREGLFCFFLTYFDIFRFKFNCLIKMGVCFSHLMAKTLDLQSVFLWYN